MPISTFSWAKALQEVSQIRVKSIADPLFKYALITLVTGAAGGICSPLGFGFYIFCQRAFVNFWAIFLHILCSQKPKLFALRDIPISNEEFGIHG